MRIVLVLLVSGLGLSSSSALAGPVRPQVAPQLTTASASLPSATTLPSGTALPGGGAGGASSTSLGVPRSQGPAPLGAALAARAVENGTIVGKYTQAGTPYLPLFDPANSRLYISDDWNSTITVINTTTNATRWIDLPVGSTPQGLAFGKNDSTLFVAENSFADVARIDTRSLRIVGNTTVGMNPGYLLYTAFDGNLYVTNGGTNTVMVIKASTGLVTTTLMVGANPVGIVYDAATNRVYVACNGVSTLVAIDPTTMKVVSSLNGFFNPNVLILDPYNGELLVTNGGYGAGTQLTVVNVSSNTIAGQVPVGRQPWYVIFDPASQLVYVANRATSNITVLNATTLKSKASLSVGVAPEGLAVDPANGLLYVAANTAGVVDVISTLLAVGNGTLAPPGQPTGSSDVGQSVTFSGSLYATGDGVLNYSVLPYPAAGAGCGTAPNVTGSPNGTLPIELAVNCTSTAAGNYTLVLFISDGTHSLIGLSLPWMVFSDPRVLSVTPASGAVDVGGTMLIVATAVGGTGSYTRYNWTGLDPACGQPTSASVQCRPGTAGTLIVRASVTDSNGFASPLSPGASVVVYPALAAPGAPVPSRNPMDVGQNVSFSASGSGGSGVYPSYAWTNLSFGACTGTATATVSCSASLPGTFQVSASVVDSTGASSPEGAPVAEVVYPRPALSPISTASAIVDVGESVALAVTLTGGAPSPTYFWGGLPAGCASSNASTLLCTPTGVGSSNITVFATDSDGVSTAPSILSFAVNPRPAIEAVAVSSGSIAPGDSYSISVLASGGTPPLSYGYQALPPGCLPRNSDVVDCVAGGAGRYLATITVTDSQGYSAHDLLRVNITAPSTGPTQSGGGFGGIWLYGLISAVVLASALAAFFELRRRRRRVMRDRVDSG